jgi:outer membrane receptor protein involved in Fe transport
MKKALLLLSAIFCTLILSAQTRTITGKITDAESKEGLPGATVLIKGTQTGTITDDRGEFKLDVTADAKVLTISYVGYAPKDVPLGSSNIININIEAVGLLGKDVEITSTRVSENIKQAAVDIEKMTARDIRSAASGDFYQSLANFKGVDMVTSSALFKVINLRGFADTRSLRVKQYIDGLDNEAPGLNFPIGNMVGANDMDLQSVEVLYGPASALYGANAMQGVIAMTTRDPYLFQGVGISLKGGYTTVPGPYVDVQARYAQAFGKNKKWAIKFTGGFLQMKDWVAEDDSFNRYGKINADVNVSAILREKQYEPVGPDFTQEEKDDIVALNSWLDFNPAANPGIINVKAPGYMEKDLADYNTKSIKAAAEVQYKFNDNLRLVASYKFGYGTAVYQATARYQIKNFTFHQPRVELRGKNFFVRAYANMESAGSSYNLGLTGAYVSRAAIPDWVSRYIDKYFDVLDTASNGFCADCIDGAEWAPILANAQAQATAHADSAWYVPGSQLFKDSFNTIIKDPNSLTGTQFYDKTKMVHVDAQYNWDFVKWLDILTGASYRIYMPDSRGTIFEDTAGKKIRLHEFGAFAQATKRLWKDHIKLIASVRVDKNSNFKAQMSPRGAIVFTFGNREKADHNIRISAGSAFRTPTLQDQYLYLDIGRIKLLGNLNGYDNLYTLTSVENFRDYYEANPNDLSTAVSYLQPIKIEGLKPERAVTVEVGYRTEIRGRLLIDVSAYYSRYKNFIGFVRVVSPNADSTSNGQAGEESGVTNLVTGFSRNYQMWMNNSQIVPSWGASIGISYYIGKGITPYINYTYADLDDKNLKAGSAAVLSGFNTPNNKFNIGVMGNKVWRGLGFSANFKWVQAYEWQNPFGDGTVPSYHTLDLQVSYEVEKIFSTFRVGAMNIYNNKHIEAVGGPKIGGTYYAQWAMDLNLPFKK